MSDASVQRIHDAAVALGASCHCRRRASARRFAKDNFDPDEPRDDRGRWTGDSGDGDDGASATSGHDGDAGSKPVQVADSGQVATDAQVAQDDEGEIPLGLPTARVVIERQVETGQMTRQKADELLAGIAANDAGAQARINAALRGYVDIPNGWTATPDGDNEGGIIYRNPDNPGYDNVRIMPGDPQRSNPVQRDPYVIDQKSGSFLTTDGSRVRNRRDPATHIPLQDYRFDKR